MQVNMFAESVRS